MIILNPSVIFRFVLSHEKVCSHYSSSTVKSSGHIGGSTSIFGTPLNHTHKTRIVENQQRPKNNIKKCHARKKSTQGQGVFPPGSRPKKISREQRNIAGPCAYVSRRSRDRAQSRPLVAPYINGNRPAHRTSNKGGRCRQFGPLCDIR